MLRSNPHNFYRRSSHRVFGVLCTVEAALKIFFQEGWNQLDFFLVCGSYLSLLLYIARGGPAEPDDALERVLRSLREARVLQLLKNAKEIRAMFHTLVVVLPGIANVCSLISKACAIWPIFLPAASIASASRSFLMICSGLCFLLFMKVLLAQFRAVRLS